MSEDKWTNPPKDKWTKTWHVQYIPGYGGSNIIVFRNGFDRETTEADAELIERLLDEYEASNDD